MLVCYQVDYASLECFSCFFLFFCRTVCRAHKPQLECFLILRASRQKVSRMLTILVNCLCVFVSLSNGITSKTLWNIYVELFTGHICFQFHPRGTNLSQSEGKREICKSERDMIAGIWRDTLKESHERMRARWNGERGSEVEIGGGGAPMWSNLVMTMAAATAAAAETGHVERTRSKVYW